MSISNLLQTTRRLKNISMESLAQRSGLTYGKVYRILTGDITKPAPETLKRISDAMNLDYRHLFKLIEYTGLEEVAEEDPWDLHKLPVLDWDYCYFAFPFEDPIELALSDDHVFYPREVKDGFSLVINQENEMVPFFNIGDVVVCAPPAIDFST